MSSSCCVRSAALSCNLIGVAGERRRTTKASCSRNDRKAILLQLLVNNPGWFTTSSNNIWLASHRIGGKDRKRGSPSTLIHSWVVILPVEKAWHLRLVQNFYHLSAKRPHISASKPAQCPSGRSPGCAGGEHKRRRIPHTSSALCCRTPASTNQAKY